MGIENVVEKSGRRGGMGCGAGRRGGKAGESWRIGFLAFVVVATSCSGRGT